MIAPRTLLLLALAVAPALRAQELGRGPLEIQLPGDGRTLTATEHATVVTRGVLGSRKVRGLLEHSFPARMHFHVELYKKNRWIDESVWAVDWDVFVSFDPALRRYSVQRLRNQQREDLGSFSTIDSATAAAERPYALPAMSGMERGRQYYFSARLEVKALQMSDFDAVQSWLRGELHPANEGKRNVVTALQEGVGTILSRVIGGDQRAYETRSGVFSAG